MRLTAPLRGCLVVCFLVCPLLFFTNLTRNPYITQICLLNAGLLLAGAWLLWEVAGGRAAWPKTALNVPLAAWVGVCALSWLVSFSLHRPFFRPAIEAEGARGFLFLLANALCPFYVAAAVGGAPQDGDSDAGAWAVFAVLWGLLWVPFSQLRGGPAAPTDVWGHLWDGYGAFVWAAGLAGALWLCRKARWGDFLHLALTSGFLASAYGVLQYFNVELIWPNTLNPYGGRSVSTFGNPNFMSSFNVVLLPIAVALFSRASGARRLVYGALALTLEAALLCSLTRSSWIGALVAMAVLLLCSDFRARAKKDPRPHGTLAAAGVAMALLWPSSLIVSGYTPSVIGRVSEIVSAARTHAQYSSFSQRVLIWTCGWLMGRENPLTGKGYGLFELFYPFYQGPVLAAFEGYRSLRTHANNGHNELVETFATTGLLGVGVLLWLWTTFFAAGRRWLGRAGDRGMIYAAALAGAAGMLVDNLLNVSLHFAVPAFLFWWVVGLVSAPAPAAATADKRPARASAVLTWGLRAAAGCLVALCWVWVCVWFREVDYFAGFKLVREHDFPAAIAELERSRSWGPREVNAIYELGNAYAQSQSFDKADAAYEQALRANAGYDEIYYNIGAVKSVHLNQPEAALEYFQVAHLINPLSPEVYASLGNLYLANPARYGRQAQALLEEAVRFFPDNPNNWNNLGYLYTLGRRWDDAERAYTRALLLDPGLTVAARNLLAMAQQAHRPPAKILASLRDLSALEAKIAKRDYSEATLALSQRLDRELPDNAQARFFLGSLLMARGRAAEAVAPLEFAAQRQPDNVWVHVNLGEAYRALGRADDARAQFRAALALDAGNAVARQRLSQLGP